MPVINGVYLKDFAALPSAVVDANIIPIAISGDQVAYRTTVGGIVTDARVTSKLLTGLSVTGGAIASTDTILQAFGKVQNQINSKVSSVGLTMPAAFNVANSPITSAGTLAVTAAGVASQYIRGDGALADFPTNGGGGSSVSYYLNGSVNQGTFVGNTYYEMNKTPVIGTGTDFTIAADGYIAQFITDANDPAALLIPGGNWNVEMYFSASSSGGTPSFYVEVYKYNGTTFTLLGTSSATPEGITNGTAIDIYYTSVGIPETVLTITDRLAIRVYVTHSGRTITLHTEDNHLSEIVTTFSNGLTALNGLTKQAQYFATGTTGTDFNISSSVDTHTFNIPSASASNRGLITTGAQTIAGAKTFNDNISVSTSTANSAIQVTSTKADGRGLAVLATSSVEPFTVTQLGAGKLAEFVNSTGPKFTIYNSGEFEANGGTLYANLAGTTATFTGLLTGATATFTNSGAGIGVGVTNSGSGDGIKITHSLGRAFNILSSSTGYGIIINNETASTSVPFTIQKQGSTVITMTDAGGATFGGAVGVTGQLTLGSTITNGTYTYTLPSATGTLALTSALSGYLPLSGGTLTGDLTIDLTSPNLYLKRANTSSNAALRYNTGATLDWYVGTGVSGSNSDYHIYSGTTNADALTILKSTGAATFSSSVTATSYVLNNGTFRGGLFTYNSIAGTGTDYGATIFAETSYNIYFCPGGSATKQMTITSGGVGIGTTSPSYQLQLSTDSAAKPTSALWTIASDERIKENITPYTKGLADLLQINPVNYDYNGLGGFNKGKGGVGIIAQQIIDILPDSVGSVKGKLNETDEEEIDILNFNGHELTYVLINAIKELKAEIDLLKGIAPIEPIVPEDTTEPIIPTDNNLE